MDSFIKSPKVKTSITITKMVFYLLCPSKPAIDPGIVYGHTDLEVSETFSADCEKLIQLLRNLHLQGILCSPLRRSYKLGLKASEVLQLKLEADQRLMELNYGIWEMERWDTIPPTDLNIWMVDFVNVKTPGGESFADLQNRILSFLEDQQIANKLLITHSGVLRVLLCHFLNIPLIDCFKKIEFECCCVYEVNTENLSYRKLAVEA